MHFYENEVRKEAYGERASPIVRVDPWNRCAAMLMAGDQMALLPFRDRESYVSGTTRYVYL